MGDIKISTLEKALLGLTAAFLLMTTGYFLGARSAADPYRVDTQHPAAAEIATPSEAPPAAPEEFSLSGSIDAALSALGGGEPRKGGQGRNAGRRRSDKPRQEGQSKADGKPRQENKPKQENRPKQDGRPRQENRPGPKPQSKEGVRPGKSPEGQSETSGRNRRRRRRGGGKPKEGGAPAGTQE